MMCPHPQIPRLEWHALLIAQYELSAGAISCTMTLLVLCALRVLPLQRVPAAYVGLQTV